MFVYLETKADRTTKHQTAKHCGRKLERLIYLVFVVTLLVDAPPFSYLYREILL